MSAPLGLPDGAQIIRYTFWRKCLYLTVSPDYFGLGTFDEPEGYLVKKSHQQATYDMLIASRAVLDQMQLSSTKLFLAGWSQGGFVTMAFLEKLESAGISAQGAATASAPLDLFVALSGALNFPRKIDAAWLGTIFILTSFSFENYYSMPGLARSVINDQYYDASRNAYERQPFDPADIPTDLHKLVRPEYFDPQFFARSAYGRLAAQTQAYRWIIKTPVRNYYGESDEAVSTGLGQLAMSYQRAMGRGNERVEAVSQPDQQPIARLSPARCRYGKRGLMAFDPFGDRACPFSRMRQWVTAPVVGPIGDMLPDAPFPRREKQPLRSSASWGLGRGLAR